MQRNLSSRRPYRGINQLLTQLTQQLRGYSSPFWVTYRGAERAGGHVRRGERGTLVVLWKRLVVEDEESEEKKRIWWARAYTVFNLDQVDGVEPPAIEEERLDFEPNQRCERLLARMPDPPTVQHLPGGAFYIPASDTITLPPRESFHEVEGYYATRFHETVHSTGHSSRLDRELASRSSEESYSREELIAELGAAMLCGRAGIAPQRLEQSAAYIASWLAALRNDKRMVVSASQHAQRAVDHILDERPESGDETDAEGGGEDEAPQLAGPGAAQPRQRE
jgi:antirestriction protein ArdC